MAITFDCYGTLIDWESGIWDALQPLLMHNGCADIDRDRGLLAFASFETRAFEDSELTKILLSPLGDGSGRIKVDGVNTSYFHGARASFQGNYLWTGEMNAEQKKLFEKQYKENFGE